MHEFLSKIFYSLPLADKVQKVHFVSFFSCLLFGRYMGPKIWLGLISNVIHVILECLMCVRFLPGDNLKMAKDLLQLNYLQHLRSVSPFVSRSLLIIDNRLRKTWLTFVCGNRMLCEYRVKMWFDIPFLFYLVMISIFKKGQSEKNSKRSFFLPLSHSSNFSQYFINHSHTILSLL